MSPLRRTGLQVLAAASLAVLGWDAFRPLPDFPASVPVNAPAGAPQPRREAVPAAAPQFTHLTADRILTPGQRLTVRGRVRDLTPANPTTISLEGPDGALASVELRDDGTHEAAFTLEHPTPAIAPGAYTWKLRLDPSAAPILLGVQVNDSNRPRVLLLQDHPSVEGARLQRWLTEAGSPWTARTRVSAERYRVASSPDAAVDLGRLAAAALASFDIVVAHASALNRLPPEEHAALDLAIRRDGVGLLVLGSQEPIHDAANAGAPPRTPSSGEDVQTPSPTGETPGSSPLVSPWIRSPRRSTNAAEATRETRVDLFNGLRLESPITVLVAELVVTPAAQALAQDPQGRPLVATTSHGRGRWAYSIVLDSWRWRQHGHGDDYAHFWSMLLTALARPITATAGAWSIENAALPVFVDQSISLLWSSAPDTPPPAAEVQARGAPEASAIPLSLNRDPSEPTQSRAVYWAVRPGWHAVRALPAGPSLNFYVQPPQALPGVRAQQETDAARRNSLTAAPTRVFDPTPPPASWSRPLTRLIAFLIFVLSAACLWSRVSGTQLSRITRPLRDRV